MGCSSPIIMHVRPQHFVEKTFTDGSETAKNVKVFRYTVLCILYSWREDIHVR